MTSLTILVIAVLLGVTWHLLSTIASNHNFSLLLDKILSRRNNNNSTKENDDDDNDIENENQKSISFVFIFAHPDDEAMFFTPMLHLLKENKQKFNNIKTHFLCVSQGDYDKLGKIREKEMHASAKFYDVDTCQVFNDERCLDGPKAEWDLDFVAKEIVQKKAIEELKADVIFTFDDFGVSGHTNHRQVYQAVKKVALLMENNKKNSNHSGVIFYKLVSHPIWRKYSSIFGVIVRNIVDRFLHASDQHSHEEMKSLTVIVPPKAGLLSMRGLWNHYSQFVWFRFFYVLLASYSYENIFVEI